MSTLEDSLGRRERQRLIEEGTKGAGLEKIWRGGMEERKRRGNTSGSRVGRKETCSQERRGGAGEIEKREAHDWHGRRP